MLESRTYGSVRGACDETHVPTATTPRFHHLGRRRGCLRRAQQVASAANARRLSRPPALGRWLKLAFVKEELGMVTPPSCAALPIFTPALPLKSDGGGVLSLVKG